MKKKIIVSFAVIAALTAITICLCKSGAGNEAMATTAFTVNGSAKSLPIAKLEPTLTPIPSTIMVPSPSTPASSNIVSPEPTPTITPSAIPTATPAPTATPKPAKKQGIVTSASGVNIRKKASTDSDIVGKMYTGAVLTVVKEGKEWSQIKSGDITGYVKNDLITFSKDISKLIKKYKYTYAVITADTLNVRSKASTTASRVTKVKKSSKHKILATTDEWVKIAIHNTEQIGYVKKEFISVKTKTLTAISTEEDRKNKETIAKKLEELKKEQAAQTEPAKQPTTTEESSTKKSDKGKKPSGSKSTTTPNSNVDNVTLLAGIIYCESGNQSYEGKLAVANVVLNRVKSGRYPNTIKQVIYQRGQFSPASSGSLARVLNSSFSSRRKRECIRAAKDALAGKNNIGSRTNFRSSCSVSVDDKPNAIKIGSHVFW